jgi:predicted helicase
MIANLLPDNSNRRTAQKERDIDVVIGNPPYSVGQSSANDNAANVSYENLDLRIEQTYALHTQSNNKNALYDSYIKSFRWASDRIKDKGIIGFVSNAGWLDGNAMDGMRKCLVDEFSKIYIFHLRGNQRTQGEISRKEGGKIFGSGSRTPVSINILVRNPESTDNGKIFFHDIGDYLDRKQKLSIIKNFKSIAGISSKNKWREIKPDGDNDWLNQGNSNFVKFISVGDKKNKSEDTIFSLYSRGLESARDTWVYNFSKDSLLRNLNLMAETYNEAIQSGLKYEDVCKEENKIKWSSSLVSSFNKKIFAKVDHHCIRDSVYRPFSKGKLYFESMFIHRMGQLPKIYPKKKGNLVICIAGVGSSGRFSSLMSNSIVDLQLMFNGQVFPLKYYEINKIDGGLFENLDSSDEFTERDGISDEGFAHFQTAYLGKQFTKEDLFYYIYGILHSTEYKERFQNNLGKELPRIPAVPDFEDFMAFSEAGRKLGELHVNYETVEPFNVDFKEGDFRLLMADKTPEQFYRVTKMKFGGKRGSEDKTTVIYNGNITMQNIPMEAYDYIVNGRPALEWVMERQVVKTDKKSGITNDANDYANETMNDPAYPLKLFQRVITVSLETMKIVNNLPALGI